MQYLAHHILFCRSKYKHFFFFICFGWTSLSFLIIFSSVAPHRAKCYPRWQPTRRLAVSCGLGRHRIRTRDCRTTVRRATTEPPCLPYLPREYFFKVQKDRTNISGVMALAPPLLSDSSLCAVPNSRINSWESWFIFNLQKNKHQVRDIIKEQ